MGNFAILPLLMLAFAAPEVLDAPLLSNRPVVMDMRPYALGEYRDHSRITYCYNEAPANEIADAAARHARGELDDAGLREALRWILALHECRNEPQRYTYLQTLRPGRIPVTAEVEGKEVPATKDASVFLTRLHSGMIVYAVTHARVPATRERWKGEEKMELRTP